MHPESSFAAELNGIKAAYDGYRAKGHGQSIWAPLNRVESEWRCRQLAVLCAHLRDRGWSNLGGKRILDFGCGQGRHLRQFLDLGADPDALDGIDLDPPAVLAARHLSPNLRVQVASGIRLPYPDATFDLITQHVVFSSIPSAELRMQIARELDRVLRPGGFFFWWDMDHMAAAAGGHAVRLDAKAHFPDYAGGVSAIAPLPPPGDAIRPLRFIGRILRRLVNALGPKPTHCAALFEKPAPPHATT
jgi:SAM-dependent methyltransferase